jgi:hypothetical protein
MIVILHITWIPWFSLWILHILFQVSHEKTCAFGGKFCNRVAAGEADLNGLAASERYHQSVFYGFFGAVYPLLQNGCEQLGCVWEVSSASAESCIRVCIVTLYGKYARALAFFFVENVSRVRHTANTRELLPSTPCSEKIKNKCER